MNPLTRRSIMQIIGGSIAAAPRLAEAAPRLLAIAEPLTALAAGSIGSTDRIPANIETAPHLPKALADKLIKLRDSADSDSYLATMLRSDGLDHDIACLRSPSRAWKVNKQLARMREERDLLQALRHVIWPNH